MDRAKIAKDLDQAAMQEFTMELPNVKRAIEGKSVRKVIAVPGKLVNIVVG
ncbi:Leucine--tRNA ligase [compost metagenome]